MLILFYFQLDDLLDDCGGSEGFDWRWSGRIWRVVTCELILDLLHHTPDNNNANSKKD